MSSNLDMEWVKSQLQEAKVRKIIGDSVINLIEHLETFDKLSDEHRVTVVDLFSKLAVGHAHIKVNEDEMWIQVTPGQIKVADQIRGRSDAFTGPLGAAHNGRRGIVVAVRYGDVIIKSSDGREPVLDGAHYAPQKLEKLIIT
jgi:hypothetical protein